MSDFEAVLARVASGCEYAYGMSRVGYLYESVKDNLRWTGLRPKMFARLIMRIGDWMALDDEQYNKEKVRLMSMDSDEIAELLKARFGGGE